MPCHVSLDQDILSLDTGRCRRTFDWNHGHLISRTLEDTFDACRLDLSGQMPRCQFPGIDAQPSGGDLVTRRCPATGHLPEQTQVTVTTTLGKLQLRQVFRLYPN